MYLIQRTVRGGVWGVMEEGGVIHDGVPEQVNILLYPRSEATRLSVEGDEKYVLLHLGVLHPDSLLIL